MNAIDVDTQIQIRQMHYRIGERLAVTSFQCSDGDPDAAIDRAHNVLPTIATEAREIQAQAGVSSSEATARWQLEVLRGFVDRAEAILDHVEI